MTNKELFKKTYAEQLKINHAKYPEIYAWPIEEFEQVLSRMYASIERGNFNKDSHSFKATCKALKIKHTYRDIECFLGGYKI
jgi:hypothetical protein